LHHYSPTPVNWFHAAPVLGTPDVLRGRLTLAIDKVLVHY